MHLRILKEMQLQDFQGIGNSLMSFLQLAARFSYPVPSVLSLESPWPVQAKANMFPASHFEQLEDRSQLPPHAKSHGPRFNRRASCYLQRRAAFEFWQLGMQRAVLAQMLKATAADVNPKPAAMLVLDSIISESCSMAPRHLSELDMFGARLLS